MLTFVNISAYLGCYACLFLLLKVLKTLLLKVRALVISIGRYFGISTYATDKFAAEYYAAEILAFSNFAAGIFALRKFRHV